jgi:hemolysin III
VQSPRSVSTTDRQAAVDRRLLRLSGEPGAPRLRGWLHLAALVAAVPAGAALLRHSRSPAATTSAGLYAAALVALYAVSTAYHLGRWPTDVRARMRQLDRAMIYVFIGACYTPLCVLAIGGTFGAVVLGLGWLAAIYGAVTTMGRATRSLPSSAGYLAVGWLAVITFPSVARRLDATGLILLLAGGVTYTAGSVVLALRRPDPSPATFGYHEVWHALVIVASALHYVLFWRLVRV